MGADLCLISIPGFYPNPKRREEIRAAFTGDITIPECIKDILGMEGEEDKEVIDAWRDAVLAGFDGLTNSREITSVYTHTDHGIYDEGFVWVTGGMSWGDDLSAYFARFQCMSYSPVYPLLVKWAKEDRAEALQKINDGL